MSKEAFQVITPVDGTVYITGNYMDLPEIREGCMRARKAQSAWQKKPIEERLAYITKVKDLLDEFLPEIAETVCWSMGRPIKQAKLVISPLRDRLQFMLEQAVDRLKPREYSDQPKIRRYIERVPHGIVLVIGPWNYPFLTVANVVFPALITGNAVILKHALQTHKTALVLQKIIERAGYPQDLFQVVAGTHDTISEVIKQRLVDFVSFTGSVRGGKEIEIAAAGTFIGCNLELGGKDPAYIAEDCDLAKTAQGIAEGSFFNSGQCCCGLERIYVRKEVAKDFIEALVEETYRLKLGDPTQETTTLGPMVSHKQADQVRKELTLAMQQGAQALIQKEKFARDTGSDAYLAPQILTRVNHSMNFMQEETFGPCLGIMEVASDEEALALMNDSSYGLTASIWTQNRARAEAMAPRIETGTVFMNRCDFLDPYLPWSGVKDTGRGCSLSVYGFDILTKTKGYHLRKW